VSTTATQIEELAGRYGDAWNTQDLEGIVAKHAPDGIFQLHAPGSAPVQGHAALREAFAGFLTQLPDIHFEPVRLRAGEDFWVLESRMSGTVSAPIEVEDETIEATGTRVDVDFLDVIAVEDGLLARKDSYLDTLGFQTQLSQ
jgi:ketosteroid isomerase-like protein